MNFFKHALLLSTALASITFAQDALKEIVIEGNQRIERDTILRYLDLRKGDLITPLTINDSLKKLFASGFFADVNISEKDGVLAVKVVENPIISRIAFEGNKSVPDTVLEREVQLKSRATYTQQKVQAEQQRLLALFRKKGRFGATVEPQVIQRDQNRVDIVFEIAEGPQTEVSTIHFLGNEVFSDNELRSAISTQESQWYRFWANDDIYDPDRLNADKEMLRVFYLKNGYADFNLSSAVAELTPEQDAFILTFSLEEGQRYKVGTLDFDIELPDVDPETLRQHLKLETGDWYDISKIDKTVTALTKDMENKGFAFVAITPIPKKNLETQTIDLTFKVQEGPKIYIQRINITGNLRTIDSVIRRDMKIFEGDPFNASKIQDSITALKDTRFFKDVGIERKETDHPDKVDLEVAIKEQSTAAIDFGGGWGSMDGWIAQVRLSDQNVFGRAYSYALTLRYAQRNQFINLDFANPHFMDHDNLSAGFALNHGRTDNTDQNSTILHSTGFRPWIGYHLTEHWVQVLNYNINHTRQTYKSGASAQTVSQSGKFTTSAVGQTLTYDVTDSHYLPHSGYKVSVHNEFAGLGGNVRYLDNTVSGSHYTPLSEHWIFKLSAKSGAMFGLGQTLRTTNKYTLGGYDLRGYDFGEVGPHSQTGNLDALGGDRLFRSSAQLIFPIGIGQDIGLRGSIFADAGTTWDSKYGTSDNVYNSKAMRYSAGVGLVWESPMGRLSVEFAKPFNLQKGDKTREFLFSMGTGHID